MEDTTTSGTLEVRSAVPTGGGSSSTTSGSSSIVIRSAVCDGAAPDMMEVDSAPRAPPATLEEQRATDVYAECCDKFTKVPGNIHPPVMMVINVGTHRGRMLQLYVKFGGLEHCDTHVILMSTDRFVSLLEADDDEAVVKDATQEDSDDDDDADAADDAGLGNAVRHFALQQAAEGDVATRVRNMVQMFQMSEKIHPLLLLNAEEEAKNEPCPVNDKLFQDFNEMLRVRLWRAIAEHKGKQRQNIWNDALIPLLYTQIVRTRKEADEAREEAAEAHQEAAEAHQEAAEAQWQLGLYQGTEKAVLQSTIATREARIRELQAQLATAAAQLAAAQAAHAVQQLPADDDEGVAELRAQAARALDDKEGAEAAERAQRDRQVAVTGLVVEALTKFSQNLPDKDKDKTIDLVAARNAFKWTLQFAHAVLGALTMVEHVVEVHDDFKVKPAACARCHPDKRNVARTEDPAGVDDTYEKVSGAGLAALAEVQRRLTAIAKPLPARAGGRLH